VEEKKKGRGGIGKIKIVPRRKNQNVRRIEGREESEKTKKKEKKKKIGKRISLEGKAGRNSRRKKK